MRLADGLRRHSFETWYERELLQSHAHLALTFICAVGVLAVFEPGAGGLRSLADQAQSLATLVVCCGVGIWSLRRYLYLLSHAEATAHQADCPACGTYARFKLVTDRPPPDDAEDAGVAVVVCCKRCDRHWTIVD